MVIACNTVLIEIRNVEVRAFGHPNRRQSVREFKINLEGAHIVVKMCLNRQSDLSTELRFAQFGIVHVQVLLSANTERHEQRN